MIPYIIFYSLSLTLVVLSLVLKKYDWFWLLFLLFISIIFIGLRVNVGADYTEYVRIYNQSYDTNFELGFDIIFNLFKRFGYDYVFVSLFVFILTSFFFLYSIKSLQHKTLIYFCFLLFMFVPLTSTIRQGLAIPFFIICLLNADRPKVYFMSIAIGSFFHYSILFMLFFFFVRYFKQSYCRAYFIILFFLGLSVFNIVEYMIILLHYIPSLGTLSSKLLMYTQRYNVTLSLTSVAYKLAGLLLVTSFMSFIKINKKLLCSYNLYYISLCLFILFKDNSVFTNRLMYATNISLVTFFSFLLSMMNAFYRKAIVTFLFVIYFSINYFKFTATDLRHSIESAYMPYKSVLIN
ncbi:O56 family O-antigen polymerase [Escherichia coli]|uniref:O56 family O-antigen polymerase n=1 Tax=Escherichia coli TaxID=562 RepID=UPI0016B1399A|nr:O56 family O-antigen polymerase [Escherichia coli]EFJ5530702.1 O56 family O-antigen polymerase [Escherichia coli]EHN4692758.1 O56 family O-antigen polymerase [Escherichia coli]MBL7485655.1 O56 family O-antigen polymerase [Escherichia coli]HAW0236576.1 O56 family O-antigen polymerase [Escherichia coli]